MPEWPLGLFLRRLNQPIDLHVQSLGYLVQNRDPNISLPPDNPAQGCLGNLDCPGELFECLIAPPKDEIGDILAQIRQ